MWVTSVNNTGRGFFGICLGIFVFKEMLFSVLPSLAFSGMFRNSRMTKKHFIFSVREGNVLQKEWLHPNWLAKCPKASPSPVRRRSTNVAMMCHLLGLLAMSGLTNLGKAVRFSNLGWCSMWAEWSWGWGQSLSRMPKKRFCGLFPLHGGSFPPLLRLAPASLILIVSGISDTAQSLSCHFLSAVQHQADLKLQYLAWQGRDPHPIQMMSHSLCGPVCETVTSCPSCERLAQEPS